MVQRLHLVFGGELVDPSKTTFKNIDDMHIVGMYPDYQSAYDAWMFRLRPDEPAELEALLDASGYGKLVEAESH